VRQSVFLSLFDDRFFSSSAEVEWMTSPLLLLLLLWLWLSCHVRGFFSSSSPFLRLPRVMLSTLREKRTVFGRLPSPYLIESRLGWLFNALIYSFPQIPRRPVCRPASRSPRRSSRSRTRTTKSRKSGEKRCHLTDRAGRKLALSITATAQGLEERHPFIAPTRASLHNFPSLNETRSRTSALSGRVAAPSS